MRSEISPLLLAFFQNGSHYGENRDYLCWLREREKERERNGSVKECDLYFLTSTVVAAVKFPTHVVFPFASRLIPPPEILFQVFFSFHLPNGKLLLSPSFLSFLFFCLQGLREANKGWILLRVGKGSDWTRKELEQRPILLRVPTTRFG